MNNIKFIAAVLMLSVSLALIPFAWDWRSPFLSDVRPWLLRGMIVLPLGLILFQAWILWNSSSSQRTLKAVSALGLFTAILALATTAAIEARFHWVRYQVLHADPSA